MAKKDYRKSYLPLIIAALSFLLIYLVGIRVPGSVIRQIIAKAGPYGVITLIFLFWITNVIAPLSGSPLLFSGFYAYGQMVVVYAFVAAMISSATNFWIARIWGRRAVEKLAGAKNLEKIDRLAEQYGLRTLFIFRLFMNAFHDAISYAFGLTAMKFREYIAVSTLGMVPATIIWYLVSIKVRSSLVFVVVSYVFAFSALVAYAIWIKLEERKKALDKSRSL
jgi:uncharacterized membrane protein YdjX (TVP38/TMEM64 family)